MLFQRVVGKGRSGTIFGGEVLSERLQNWLLSFNLLMKSLKKSGFCCVMCLKPPHDLAGWIGYKREKTCNRLVIFAEICYHSNIERKAVQ